MGRLKRSIKIRHNNKRIREVIEEVIIPAYREGSPRPESPGVALPGPDAGKMNIQDLENIIGESIEDMGLTETVEDKLSLQPCCDNLAIDGSDCCEFHLTGNVQKGG